MVVPAAVPQDTAAAPPLQHQLLAQPDQQLQQFQHSMMANPSQQLHVSSPEFMSGQAVHHSNSSVSFNGVTEVRIGVRRNTLLQTARVVLQYGDIQVRARLLFDICAQHSFINEELSQKLRLPTIGRDNMILNAFEKDSSEKRKLCVVQLPMKGCCKTVKVELYVVPQICAPVHGQTIGVAQQSHPYLCG